MVFDDIVIIITRLTGIYVLVKNEVESVNSVNSLVDLG